MSEGKLSPVFQMQGAEQSILQAFLRWMIAINAVIALVSLLYIILSGYREGIIGFAAVVVTAILFVCARQRALKGQVIHAVELSIYTLVLICLFGVIYMPASVISATIGSFIAAVLGFIYLEGRKLRWIVLLTWMMAGAFWSIAASNVQMSLSVPQKGIIFANVLLLYTLVLLLLWHWRTWLRRQAQVAEQANQALREAQVGLEARVATRTAALSQAVMRYQIASELTSDYTYSITIHQDGRITTDWATDAIVQITGYRPAEIDALGGFQAIVHPDDKAIAERRAEQVLAGQSDNSELRIIRRDGAVRWLRAYVRPIWDAANQRVSHAYGAMADITERKHAEDERLQLEFKLREAQRMESLGVLAGGVAHDFNNLLLSILGSASLARLDLPEDAALTRHLTQIELAARRAAELTQQMLAYAGRGRFDVQTVFLSELVLEMAQLLYSSISKQIQLHFALKPDLPPVRVDVTQIRQVIMNLIVNAAEAIGDEPGSITLTTTTINADEGYLKNAYITNNLLPGTYIILTVADTGIGMDHLTLQRMFEPFFTTKLTGRGLGLAAVLGIIRGHGGTLKVQSAVGQGSIFTLVLPVSTEVIEQPSQTKVEPTMLKPLQNRVSTVLIVDDEAEVRAVTSRILQRAGYDVLTTADGQGALDLVRERQGEIDGILMDMTMTGMSGLETFYALQEFAPNLPVALMSGYSEDDALQRFQRIRPRAFLQKPFSAIELQRLMGELLQAGDDALRAGEGVRG